MALTRTGYSLTTSGDYLDNIVQKLNAAFPNMSNASNNFAIVLSRIIAEILEENDAIRAEGYNNVYVATATGIHLNKAVATAGIVRRYGTKSYGKIKITKTEDVPSISIAPDTLIESGDFQFITINENFVNINTSEPIEVEIASVNTGLLNNMQKHTEFKPVVSIRGLDKMICEEGTSGGTDTESDQDLRARYYLTMGSYSNTSLNGIISEVARMEDIVRVTGRENSTDEEVNGLPPHSFELYCEGASDNNIAKKIFDVKPAGIQTHGDVTVQVEYNSLEYPISFSRFDKQTVYYKLSIRPNIGASSTELEKNVKEAIIKYTSISTKINHSELVGYLYNNVDGIAIMQNITFGLSPNPSTDDEITTEIGMTFNTTEDNITVTLIGGI